ncbi:hypothetical protein TWF694_000315 [Orbilia ellipsospora]|uniref:Uncharacterized protein n=1 Tax=Orbilia ellipsospora TaxID=2528407 RepID=A0AAV9XNP7_9PEZI
MEDREVLDASSATIPNTTSPGNIVDMVNSLLLSKNPPSDSQGSTDQESQRQEAGSNKRGASTTRSWLVERYLQQNEREDSWSTENRRQKDNPN